jgi:hypothetical protein
MCSAWQEASPVDEWDFVPRVPKRVSRGRDLLPVWLNRKAVDWGRLNLAADAEVWLFVLNLFVPTVCLQNFKPFQPSNLCPKIALASVNDTW